MDAQAAKSRRPDPGAVGIGLAKIALAHTDSTDTVTFEFTGNAIPGWAVHYVRQALQNDTQTIIPIAAPAVLEVLVREAANPFQSAPPPYSGPAVLSDPTLSTIGEVRFASVVRGVTQVFIALRTEQVGFRVSGALDPARVVVEFERR
ncbi:hypothetical protein D5S18_14350 [Nocardia panacis]|uniref:AMIN-like domain-containing protein n=1 Tax=Nocardia panacis TaxID=2340916 RepID=A0A3A4KBR3_9NOCA|nr:hypothetical protein D5S18_14350 [Nocardia panacis]